MGAEASSCALTSLRYGAQVSGVWGRGMANPKGKLREVTFIECCLCTIISIGLTTLHDCMF